MHSTIMKRLGQFVASTGAILLGSVYSVDGYYPDRIVRIVTHIHYDHLIGLERSIRESALIAGTPLTLALLEVMGYKIPASKKLPLDYNKRISVAGEELELIRSNHIPGSAQVLVELPDGTRLGYTSDFKLPSTPIMKDLDVLVVDATYGHPEWVRPWQEEIEQLLVDIVLDALSRAPVAVYGYHGKLQEVMILLRAHKVDAPFILPPKIYRMTRILQEYGYPITDCYLEGTPEAGEIMRTGWYIYFQHISKLRTSTPVAGARRPIRIILTGWELREPYRMKDSNTYIVSYSGHADYNQLIRYIQEAKPKLLIVDGYRGGEAAEAFAQSVRRRLGIPTIVQP